MKSDFSPGQKVLYRRLGRWFPAVVASEQRKFGCWTVVDLEGLPPEWSDFLNENAHAFSEYRTSTGWTSDCDHGTEVRNAVVTQVRPRV